MTDLQWLMILLPIVFMIHDFEEIVMFEMWLYKNRGDLQRRFPKLEKFLTRNGFFAYSTADFAVAVAFEFVLLSAVCYLSVGMENYGWWFAAFMAFFVHLWVHIVQWLVYGRYIPMIITTFLALPYCFYALWKFAQSGILSVEQMFWWTMAGIALMIASFPMAFFGASKFRKFREKY